LGLNEIFRGDDPASQPAYGNRRLRDPEDGLSTVIAAWFEGLKPVNADEAILLLGAAEQNAGCTGFGSSETDDGCEGGDLAEGYSPRGRWKADFITNAGGGKWHFEISSS
jgi:hypothetical protein